MMRHAAQPIEPAIPPGFQLLDKHRLKGRTRGNHGQQWLEAIAIVGNRHKLRLQLPGLNQLLNHIRAEARHVHREH